ncbi:hypothetical protein A2U01_0071074, partial [Trifolium medium]|nr:hypothetical protein [Trifolium medium]
SNKEKTVVETCEASPQRQSSKKDKKKKKKDDKEKKKKKKKSKSKSKSVSRQGTSDTPQVNPASIAEITPTKKMDKDSGHEGESINSCLDDSVLKVFFF